MTLYAEEGATIMKIALGEANHLRTGGLRCATTTGYSLATFRVALALID